MTALEAMAGGIPIVAPSVGGFPQIIENGVDGVLVDPSDESAFVESVLALLGDRSKAESLGEGALKRARDEYSAETMTRAVEALYLRYSRS